MKKTFFLFERVKNVKNRGDGVRRGGVRRNRLGHHFLGSIAPVLLHSTVGKT